MGKDIYDAGVKLGEFIFVQYISSVGNPFKDVTEVVVAKELFDFLHHTSQDREVIGVEFAALNGPLDFAHHSHVVIERRIVTHTLERQAVRFFIAAQVVFPELSIGHQAVKHCVEEEGVMRRYNKLDAAEIRTTGAESVQFLLHLAPNYAVELLGEGDNIVVVQRGHRVIDIDVLDILVGVVPFQYLVKDAAEKAPDKETLFPSGNFDIFNLDLLVFPFPGNEFGFLYLFTY